MLPRAFRRTVLIPSAAFCLAATTLVEAAVFGEDDRRDVPPSHQTLINKIGLLTDIKTRSQCTAFCLGPTVIATAAHCLFNTRDRAAPDLGNFRFKTHGRPASASAAIAGVESPALIAHVATGSMSLKVKPPIEATSDWAIVELASPACFAGGLPLSKTTAAELVSQQPSRPVYQVGYHRDFTAGLLAFGSPCRVSRSYAGAGWQTIAADFDKPSELILHSCDTGGASSGSPLLIDGPDGPEVAGINVGTYVQSRVVMISGSIMHRYRSSNVANTAVGTRSFAPALAAISSARFLKTRHDMREVQALLAGAGLFSGPRDGLYGIATHTAITSFERLSGGPVTGFATEELLRALRSSLVATRRSTKPAPGASLETGSVGGRGVTSSAMKPD